MNNTQQGQSFLDMVLQQSGSFEEIISAALINNVSITDSINIGKEVIVTKLSAEAALQFRNKRPATGLSNAENFENQNKGIGFMQIGSTFIVK